MDAYKGGMYKENRVGDRAKSMLRDEPLPANTHIQQHREIEIAELLKTKDQRPKIKDQRSTRSYIQTNICT